MSISMHKTQRALFRNQHSIAHYGWHEGCTGWNVSKRSHSRQYYRNVCTSACSETVSFQKINIPHFKFCHWTNHHCNVLWLWRYKTLSNEQSVRDVRDNSDCLKSGGMPVRIWYTLSCSSWYQHSVSHRFTCGCQVHEHATSEYVCARVCV